MVEAHRPRPWPHCAKAASLQPVSSASFSVRVLFSLLWQRRVHRFLRFLPLLVVRGIQGELTEFHNTQYLVDFPFVEVGWVPPRGKPVIFPLREHFTVYYEVVGCLIPHLAVPAGASLGASTLLISIFHYLLMSPEEGMSGDVLNEETESLPSL